MNNNFSKIIVGLELRESDLNLIRYVKSLSSIINPSNIYFIHVVENLETAIEGLPKNIPLDELLKEKMQNEVGFCFPNNGIVKTEFQVLEGDVVQQLIHWSVVKSTDLLLLGRKTGKNRHEVKIEKLVRKSPCSVIVVPDDTIPNFSKILIPTDFSEHSKMTLNLINKTFPKAEVKLINFYQVPTGYYKTGKTFEEFAEIVRGHAQKEAKAFSNQNVEHILNDDSNEFEKTVDYCKTQKCNMIAVGSQGRTSSAALILGSFAEKMVQYTKNYPLFVVKKKGENMNFLEAFFKF